MSDKSALDLAMASRLAWRREAEQLRAALEPFAEIFIEGSEDYPDDEPVVVKGGRTTDFTLTIGHFRRAAAAVSPKVGE